ncbi:MAG TPA: hypothetical protein VK859_16575, partial [bacterium]|nr:hypothetical protein [bacterium]
IAASCIYMHMHVVYYKKGAPMRTTIEIKESLRTELLRRAASKGAKGFSHIIEEALESYFGIEDKAADTRKKALSLKGSLGRLDSEKLRTETGKIRESWR